jgi:hypothetical protein
MTFYIFSSNNLTERPFSNSFLDSVPIMEHFSLRHDVIEVVVVPTIVVRTTCSLHLFRRRFLFSVFIVSSIDVLVRADQRYREFYERAFCRWPPYSRRTSDGSVLRWDLRRRLQVTSRYLVMMMKLCLSRSLGRVLRRPVHYKVRIGVTKGRRWLSFGSSRDCCVFIAERRRRSIGGTGR